MEEMNEESFEDFKKNFVKIFKKVVKRGKASISIKSMPYTTQRRGGGNAIELKASFGNDEVIEVDDAGMRMENLSPGQKTVVAICILLAFQQLYPAGFYVLDEISADLDSQYVDKIAKL
jgi:structural maintenance of chromosome 3 (chondroitin sulfate proteoglycan 6)